MNAYWIDPKGNIFEVEDRHIHSIIRQPERFGLTREKILAVYRKHREDIGTEGEAREEIMVRLMEHGWIRVRYVMRNDFYTMQFSTVHYRGDSWASPIITWVKWAVRKGIAHETSAAVFMDLHGARVRPDLQLYEIASGALYERVKKGTFAEFLNPFRRKRRK